MYWKLLFAAFYHGLFGTISYSHNSIYNPLEYSIRHFLNTSFYQRYNIILSPQTSAWVWSLTSSGIAIGGTMGALTVGFFGERIGRRNICMIVCNILFIISCLFQSLARSVNSVELLFLGRLGSGAASCISCFTPVYLMECSPDQYRSVVAMIVSIGFPFWNAIGTVVGMPQVLGGEQTWPISLLIFAAPAFIHLAPTPFFPESPKHLYLTKGNHKKAEQAIRFYHGPNADISQVIQLYSKVLLMNHDAFQVENEYCREIELLSLNRSTKVSWKVLLTTRHYRIPFFICIVANIANRLGGIDIAAQYSTSSFQLLGASPNQSAFYTVVFLQVPSIFLAFVGVLLTRKLNRRPHLFSLLATGIVAMTFFFLADLPFVGSANRPFGLIGLAICQASYYLGSGSIPKFLPGELCLQAIRSTTAGALNAVTSIVSIVIIMLYPPLKQYIGAFAVLPLLALSVITFVWLFRKLPETQNKTVEDLTELWLESEVLNEKKPLLGENIVGKYESVENVGQDEKKK